jgi:hypothetical protein
MSDQTKKRPFRGPRLDRLPRDFKQRVIAETRTPDGLARSDLTRWTGQDCRWSGYLAEIAESIGDRFEMKYYGRRVRYFMTH